jgi:hypothetical protein
VLAIPVHPTFGSIINATPSGHLSFLVTELGAPFTPPASGIGFREQCDMANCVIGHFMDCAGGVREACGSWIARRTKSRRSPGKQV